jgi:hypothetical protein
MDLIRPAHDRRAVRLSWLGAPDIEVSGRFVHPDAVVDSTLHKDRLAAIVEEGWTGWIAERSRGETDLQDVALGHVALRIEELRWRDAQVSVTFRTPTTKLVNTGQKTIRYELRGPYTAWSGPFTLGPGKSHEYEVPYPLTLRLQKSGPAQPQTLPFGALVELPRRPHREGAQIAH